MRTPDELTRIILPCLDRIGSRKGLKTGVDLDAREDAVLLEELDEGGSLGAALEKSLLVKDGARDVLAKAGGREKKAWWRYKFEECNEF